MSTPLRSFLTPSALASSTLALAVALTGITGTARAATPAVVSSVAPVHALVSAVMEGVGTPTLLIPVGRSPHTHTLKPSDAKAISHADVVFWVGPDLEASLPKSLALAPKTADVISLLGSLGAAARPLRDGDAWDHEDDHNHEGHDHKDHDDHDHKGHDHKEPGQTVDNTADHTADHSEDHDGHADHDGHDHAGHVHRPGGLDPHAWLDPQNARLWAATITTTLSTRDPEHAGAYAANLKRIEDRLTALEATMRDRMAPVAGQKVLVFHDAYQYLEHRFGLTVVGAISLDPSRPPSARHLKVLQAQVRDQGVSCLFAEPQFPDGLLKTVSEGVKATIVTVDPDGGASGTGMEAYERAMLGVADAIAGCKARG